MHRQLAFVCAIASVLSIAMLAIGGGLATPGYSHVSQFISELGATSAPHEYTVRFVGFLPGGVALLLFCVFAYRALPRSRAFKLALLGLVVYASGYVVAAFFPCDLGCRPKNPSLAQAVHNAVGGLGYLLAPAILFTFAMCSRSWPNSAPMPALGFVAASCALLGLLSLSPSSPYAGLSQRTIEASVLAWVVACGWYIQARARLAA